MAKRANARLAKGGGLGLAEGRLDQLDRSAPPLHVAAASSATAAPRFVCILGMARTGTNHLARILTSIPEIDSRYEPFNRTRSWSLRPDELEELSRRSGEAFPCSCEDSRAVSAIRRQPGLVLECLADLMAPGKRILSFKVFKDQLSVRQVRQSIISRPDTIIVFIRRRPIDTYVSHCKALQINTWKEVDTTELKIDLDAGQFLRWWRRTSKWYRWLEAACRSVNKPFHEWTYEADIDRPPGEVAQRFCALLERSGVGPLTLPQGNAPVGMKKQDRNRDISARVGNWADFHRALVAKHALDKAFEPIPHYRHTWWDRLHFRLLG